jgi:DNA-binding transcriptional MerR regulator
MHVVHLNVTERPLNARDASARLNISQSTLRTYTSHFRKAGYDFKKSGRNVLYTEQDIERITAMLQLHANGVGTITECVAIVCESSPAPSIEQVHYNTTDMQAFRDTIDKLTMRQNELESRLNTWTAERDEALMQVIRDLQQERQRSPVNKKRWWQFWK